MQLTLTEEQAERLQNELEWQAWTMASLLAGFPDSNARGLKDLRKRLVEMKALAKVIQEQIQEQKPCNSSK